MHLPIARPMSVHLLPQLEQRFQKLAMTSAKS